MDVAPRVNRRVVGGDEQRRSGASMQLDQEIEDRLAGRRVEVPGGFIGEQQRRIDDERTRNGNALLFATRQLRRERIAPVAETYLLEQLACSLLQCFSGLIRQQWRRDVVRRSQCGQKMESLKDEADLADGS